MHDATATVLIGIAAIPLLVWIYLAALRGGFWRISTGESACPTKTDVVSKAVAIIPARNEAEAIGDAVRSLLQQESVKVVVVDDSSTDGTAEMARQAGEESRLVILRGQPIEPGWTGKLWALSQGIVRAEQMQPDFYLLTDGDIRHGRDSVAKLVAIAESSNYDLASYVVKLKCETAPEKALIPAFVYFFLQLYPPAWIRSQKFKTAAAAGGCILIRPEMLERIGGVAAIRSEVIDDCALARAVKGNSGRIWMGLTDETQSLRSYGTFAEIGRMISRTAFNQLRHSTLLLAGTALGLLVTYLLPPLFLLSGNRIAVVMGGAAWFLMSITYLPMVRFYRLSPVWAITLPGVALFYLGATLHSAVRYWRGQGGEWKGRAQDVRA